MTFAWPWLLLVLLVPAVVAVGAVLRRRASGGGFPKIRRGFVSGGRPVFSATASARKPLLWRYAAVFVLATLALARPQWGHDSQPVFEGGRELLVALDLSRSMLAKDVAPSRLERARLLTATLAERLPTAKIGLIGFAGRAFVLVPPSEERTPLTAFLAGVAPDHFVEQGTDFAAMLTTARDAFTAEAATRTLVVISDGESHADAWRALLPELRQRKVHVVTVGLGTAAGAQVPGLDGTWLQTPAGSPVVSRLDATTLQSLASETGGVYLQAPARSALLSAAQAGLEAPVTGLAGKPQEGLIDRFALFLIAALAMLCWSAAREWNALPRLDTVRRRSALAGVSAAAAFGMAVAHEPVLTTNGTSEYVIESEDVPISEDPLAPLIADVERVSRLERPAAEDYLAVAQATTKYGDEQYTRSKPVEGILEDGLDAVERGRALDPKRPEWEPLHDALTRLIDLGRNPPKGGTADPANEVGAGPNPVEVPDEEQDSEGKDGKQQEKEGDGEERDVGGMKREMYDPAEWQVASLIVPLDLLDALRGQGSPAEWFRVVRQHATPEPSESAEQW